MSRTFHHTAKFWFEKLNESGLPTGEARDDRDQMDRTTPYGASLRKLNNGQHRQELRMATAGVRTRKDAERVLLIPVRHRRNARTLQH